MAGRGHGRRPQPVRDVQGADHQGRHAGEAGGVHGDGVPGEGLHLRHHLPVHLPLLRHHQAGAGPAAQQVESGVWGVVIHIDIDLSTISYDVTLGTITSLPIIILSQQYFVVVRTRC